MTDRAASRRARAAVASMAAVVALMAGACGGKNGVTRVEPHASVPTAPERTTTTNPYAVPATIDAAYVNKVLEGLNGALGDVLRLVVRTRAVPTEVVDRLKAIYLRSDDMNLELTALQHYADTQFADIKENPGDKKATVAEMIVAEPQCVFARVTLDFKAEDAKPGTSPSLEWIGLKPADPARDPKGYNPTSWMIFTEGVRADGSQPKNPCVG